MVEMLMGAVSLWNSLRVGHVVRVDLVSILVEVLLLGQVAASTVDLMGTGLEIAKLVTGRTSVIGVVKEATLREIVKTVQRN